MEVGTAYNASSLWDLNAVSAVDSSAQKAASASRNDASGDTVSISDEARKLFSEKIHQYSGGDANVKRRAAQLRGARAANGVNNRKTEGEGQGGGSGGGAGGSSASDSSNIESIKKQIESLKSQLMALASQLSGGAADAGVNGKISALQAQIGALEAQLNAAQQA